jgi:hypothetical protein
MSGSLIPNAKQQFLDANGNPLAGGFVYYYIPSTTTFKNTYQNAALTILNTNPIVLDSAGEAIIYGSGSYRQIVTDVNNNLIWDQTTVSPITLTDVGTFYSASNGSSLIGYTQGSANAVATTVQAKLSQILSVKDFGAIGDGTTDDTTAIQNALDYAYSLPGIVQVSLNGSYKVTNTLILGSSVILTDGEIICFTNGIPIIKVSKTSFNTNWKIQNVNLLYNTLQSSGSNGDAIWLAGTNTVSYMFEIDNVYISKANHGIKFATSGTSAIFMGSITNVMSYNGSGYTTYIQPPTTGAHTTINLNEIYYQGVQGSEISTSGVLYINGVTGLIAENIGCDRSANIFGLINMINCRGDISSLIFEANIINASSLNTGFCVFSNCKLAINLIQSSYNFITISGSASASLLRITDSSVVVSNYIYDEGLTLSDTSSDNYYTISTSSDSIIWNNFAIAQNGSPALTTNDFSLPNKVRRLNGIDRTNLLGGNYVMYSTAYPTTGTWAVGDKVINTAPVAGGYEGWVCTTAGTSGTWKTFGPITP